MSDPPATSAFTTTIPVVTVEDDPRYRSGLETLLAHSPTFELVGSYHSPRAALAALDEHQRQGAPVPWRLVLMDLDLPEMSGIECTRRIKERLPDVTVVVLTVFEDRGSIIEAICAGADGYLLKRTPADRVLSQLHAVLDGGSPLSAGVARTMLDLVRHLGAGPDQHAATAGGRNAAAPLFTEREHEVLACLVAGRSYKTIAAELGISIDTVRSHIRHIYGKLQVHSVAEAVSRALREGLV